MSLLSVMLIASKIMGLPITKRRNKIANLNMFGVEIHGAGGLRFETEYTGLNDSEGVLGVTGTRGGVVGGLSGSRGISYITSVAI